MELTFLASLPSYPLLFILSFLAATVLPLGSEWLLVFMVVDGFELWPVVLTATTGNVLGAATTMLLGIWGSEWTSKTLLRINESQLQKVTITYQRYGSWSLLLSWVPLIGDVLCFVAGVFRVNWLRFTILVAIGKFARYCLVAYLALQGSKWSF